MKRMIQVVVVLVAVANMRCEGSTIREPTFQHLVLGGAETPLVVLPPAFSADETTALRAGFDWNQTTPLPEIDEEGNPSIYYALILVRAREQLESLYLSGVLFDPFPLFEEESEPWRRSGILEPVGDERGTFVFALLPGAAYNFLRSETLAGHETFEVVRLRDAPASASLPSGALRYEDLVARGFTGAPGWGDELYGSEAPGSTTGPLHSGREKLRWLRSIARGMRAFADTCRRAIAAVRVGLGDTRTIRLRVRLQERDEDFLGHVADPTLDADLLTQAWQGSRRGLPVSLHGARVMFAANMWMVQRTIDANGFVRAEVPDGKRLRIQLWLQNQSGQILTAGGIFDRRINIEDDEVSRDADGINLTVADADAYVLGQVTDAWSYVDEVIGFRSRSALVVHLPAERASFAPCLSYVRAELILGAFAASGIAVGLGAASLFLPPPLGQILAGTFFAGALVAPLAVPDWDILIQGDDATSRIVPTHEYGHVHWCAQLRDVSHAAVTRGLIEGLKGLAAGSDADVPRRTLTEAWADFLAAQVAGGVDYFNLDPRSGRRVLRAGFDNGFYCDVSEQTASSVPCLEDNWQGSDVTVLGTYPSEPVAPGARDQDMDVSVGTFTTLLFDAFDGPTSTIGTGSEWNFTPSGPVLAPVTFRFSPDDESVQLEPSDWLRVLHLWRDISHDWTDGPVLEALGLVSLARGATAAQICELRNRHLDSASALVCATFRPLVRGDGAGLIGLTASGSPTGNPSNGCESNVTASVFIAADGVDAIRWRVRRDNLVELERIQPVVDRLHVLETPTLVHDEAWAPLVVTAEALRGQDIVSSASTNLVGSPICFILE